jgi:hypothetical protein
MGRQHHHFLRAGRASARWHRVDVGRELIVGYDSYYA